MTPEQAQSVRDAMRLARLWPPHLDHLFPLTDADLMHAGKYEPGGQDVYFIGDGDHIKIGISVDVPGRLRGLQTSHYRDLTLLGIIREGGPDTEAFLHVLFGHLRVRGEWFRSAPELLRFIERLRPR